MSPRSCCCWWSGVAVSQLAARARRLKVIAITDAGYLAQIHQTAALAQSAKSPDAVVDHVREQLAGLLDLQDCRFEYGMLLGHPPRLEPDGTVRTGHGRWDVEQAGLPAEEIELRVFGNGQYYGRFMLTPKPGSQAVPAGAPGGRHAGRSGRTRAGCQGACLQQPVEASGQNGVWRRPVIVGTSGSPGSLQALRYGEGWPAPMTRSLVPVLRLGTAGR